MSQQINPTCFPFVHNARFLKLRLRADASIHFELNCEALPDSADPVVHLVREVDGAIETHQILFQRSLHPSYIPKVDGEAEDVLVRYNGPAVVSELVSEPLMKRASLSFSHSCGIISVVWEIGDSGDFSATLLLDDLLPFFETVADKKQRAPKKTDAPSQRKAQTKETVEERSERRRIVRHRIAG
ncbi:MAG: hypothetical protein ABIO72_02190 [Patescibacteria group bacterium]